MLTLSSTFKQELFCTHVFCYLTVVFTSPPFRYFDLTINQCGNSVIRVYLKQDQTIGWLIAKGRGQVRIELNVHGTCTLTMSRRYRHAVWAYNSLRILQYYDTNFNDKNN